MNQLKSYENFKIDSLVPNKRDENNPCMSAATTLNEIEVLKLKSHGSKQHVLSGISIKRARCFCARRLLLEI